MAAGGLRAPARGGAGGVVKRHVRAWLDALLVLGVVLVFVLGAANSLGVLASR